MSLLPAKAPTKLAERLPTVLRGAPYTGRNLNTLRALAGLLGPG